MRGKRLMSVVVLAGAYVAMTCRLEPPAASHDEVLGNPALTARAETLKSTVVTPHPDQAIEPGRNVLWCGTFQLAWNEVCTLIGEDVHLEDEPPMVAALNRKAVTRQDIGEGSYVALAGFIRDGILERIERALDATFKGQARSQLFPHTLPGRLRPQDILAYAYLFKDLRFEVPFERQEEPLLFRGAPVAAFGTEGVKANREKHARLLRQVAILDYQDENDFVIELKTKAEHDRLVLAKVAPGATLHETITDVSRRMTEGKSEAMVPGDVLMVPKLNFDITRSYSELVGKRLTVANPDVADDLVVLLADQRTQFRLDETGARLRSEAQLFCCSAMPAPLHVMVFDAPFLILMKRSAAALPYFALWVDNAALLVPQIRHWNI